MKKIVLSACILCAGLFCNSLKIMGSSMCNFENSEEMKTAVAYKITDINISSLSKTLKLSDAQTEEIQEPMKIFGMETSQLAGIYDVYLRAEDFSRYVHENIFNMSKILNGRQLNNYKKLLQETIKNRNLFIMSDTF